MRKLVALTALAAGGLYGCAAVDVEGPLVTTPPEVLAQSRIGSISLSSRGDALVPGYYRGVEVDGLRQELERCARGDRPLNLRLDVEGDPDDRRDMTVIVEFMDPARGDLLVGRYFIRARDASPARESNVLDDRVMTPAEEVGYAVCNTVFNAPIDALSALD